MKDENDKLNKLGIDSETFLKSFLESVEAGVPFATEASTQTTFTQDDLEKILAFFKPEDHNAFKVDGTAWHYVRLINRGVGPIATTGS